MKYLAYKEGYCYVVEDNFACNTGIIGHPASNKYITLYADGVIVIMAGYAWDGPSGPALDTKDFMRGSLVHDALYQLIREDLLPFSLRKVADQVLVDLCKEDGMSWIRRWWVKKAVNLFGANAVEHSNPVLFAPEKCNEDII